MKKQSGVIAAGLAAAVMMSGLAIPVYAEKNSEDIVILYTNDVHCGYDTDIGYDGLMLYKREMQAEYEHVLLVDAGDAIQGAPIGSMSAGAYITRLMNAVGYDAAAIGNHEFDYGMEEFLLRADELNCGYICSNFYNIETGELLFAPYKMIEAGDKKIAFVGAATPESILKSAPVYFQNEKGEYIYSFGEDGDIYERIQKAVDDARNEGADHVILVGHLGESYTVEKWSAPVIASKLTGIDAIIDGHSHEVTPELNVTTKDGREIIITQTGTKLDYIGKMTISADGSITTELIDTVPAPDEDSGIAEDTWLEPDGREGKFVDEAVNREMLLIESEYTEELEVVIGHSDFDLTDKDAETGERLVRKSETNLGDLCADAYKYVMGAEVGIVNGGGVRNEIKAGDITFKDTISVFPFGNMACTAEVTGQQILDILEQGVMIYPGESGSFMHVSGIEYQINDSIPSSVKLDDKGTFLGVDGEYRVSGVRINGEPLDTEKTYVLASHDYFLKNGGDGYVFSGKCNILKDSIMSDSDILSVYIRDELGGVIPDKYRDPEGEGRIVFITGGTEDADVEAADAETGEEEDTDVMDDAGSDVSAENEQEVMTDTETDTASAPAGEKNPSTGTGTAAVFMLMSFAAAAAARKQK